MTDLKALEDRIAPEAALFSTEEARRLIEVADAEGYDSPPRRSTYSSVRTDQSTSALVASATCFALHGETSAVPLVLSALEELVRLYAYGDPLIQVAGALTALVHRMPSEEPSLLDMSNHASDLVRTAVASGLSKRTDPDAIALLVALAADESADVRKTARASLPKDHLPPWYGIFSSDPMPKALEHARTRASSKAGSDGTRKAEERVTELVGKICTVYAVGEYEVSRAVEAIASQASILPDELVVDLARQVSRPEHRSNEDPLLARALVCDGGDALLVVLAVRWADRGVRHLSLCVMSTIEKANLPTKVRTRVGMALVQAASMESRAEGARACLAELARELLPPSEANTLAEWFVAAPGDENRRDRPEVLGELNPLLGKASPDRLVDWAVRTIEHAEDLVDYRTRTLAFTMFASAPLERRLALATRYAFAEAPGVVAREDEDEETGHVVRRRWAIEQLLDASFDRERLGPKEALAANLFAAPDIRALILTSHSLHYYVLPLARKALVRGELTYEEALSTVRAITAVFDRDNAPHPPSQEMLDAIAPTLGPPDERIPLTEEERAAYVRLREARFVTDRETLDLDVMGEDSSEGQARIQTLVEAAISFDPKAIQAFVRSIYQRAAGPATQKAVERILEEVYDDEYTGPAAEQLAALRVACDFKMGRKFGDHVPARPTAQNAPQKAFLDAASARSLLDRATDAFFEDVIEPRLAQVAMWHAQSAAVLASAACVLHATTAATRLLAAGLEADFVDRDVRRDLRRHLGMLVGMSPPSARHVRELADDDNVVVRLAVAEGLDSSVPAAREILTKLVRDPKEVVRNAARSVLGEGAVPWWMGVFSRDPSEQISPEDEARLTPVLREIVSALGPSEDRKKPKLSPARIRRLSRALPANLACELATSQGRGLEAFHTPSPWVAPVLDREGGEDTFFALLRVWSSHFLSSKAVAAVISALPTETRRRYLRRTLKAALDDGNDNPLGLYALVTDAAKSTDVETLAHELLTLTEHESFGKACERLDQWFATRRSVPRLLSEWALAELRKPREDHDPRGSFAEDLAWKLPPAQLRPSAYEALGSTSRTRRRWALRAVLTRCHSTVLDGSKAARLKAFFDDPAFRAEMLRDADLLDLCLPLARTELFERRLDFDSAFRVAETVAGGAFAMRPTRKGKRLPAHPKLTSGELDAYLALREGHVFESTDWRPHDLHIIEGAPDALRDHLARSLEAVRAGDVNASEAVGIALYGNPTETVFETGKLMAEVYAEAGVPTILDMGMKKAYAAFGEPIPKWYRQCRTDTL